MPRFAILRHDPPPGSPRPLHWDLLLEDGDSLLTWALAEPPVAGRPIAADALANHRPAYLDYEGPVSGGRGTVSRWDAGTFQWQRRGEREIVVVLRGQALQGEITLSRPDDPLQPWQFFAGPQDES